VTERKDICFVVMPFGMKPIPDSGGRTYDFEKVYRVILRRAIRQAGLEPLRADEISGSHMIHTDMFKSLRDRPVVLADLSLANPNVYYELGIRHVMASRGTVLTCRLGSELPFDVRLSRVIFYDYDGQSLDWEEVERVVNELQFALESAADQKPDSPVHALLEQVLPARELSRYGLTAALNSSSGTNDESLDGYQRLVASLWTNDSADTATLLKEVGTSVFGSRSLGYKCLLADDLPEAASLVAARLCDVGQYDLANRIFEHLGDELEFEDLLRYGSSVSEEHGDLIHAERGLDVLRRALAMVLPRLEQESPPAGTVRDAFKGQAKLAGMLAWKWELSGQEQDLAAAVEALQTTDGFAKRLLGDGGMAEIGRVAQVRLRLLLLLRILNGDPDRPDSERLRDAILDLTLRPEHPAREASYLRWYQALALADAGEGERSRELALHTFSEDSAILGQLGCEDIGRKQYTLLRRFIDHYSQVLRHPVLVAHVAQVLQLGHGLRSATDAPSSWGRTAL
jgi:hypothetical protein